MKQKIRLKKLLIICGILSAVLLTLILLRQNENISDFLHKNLSRNIIGAAGRFSSLVSFSFYEIFLYAMGIFILTTLICTVVFLCKKRWKNALKRIISLVLVFLCFFNIYFASTGFAYKKENPALLYSDFKVTAAQLTAMCDYFLDDFNALSKMMERDKNGMTVAPYSDTVLSEKLANEFKRAQIKDLYDYTPRAKTMLSSKIMSHMQVSGVFFAPFGEAIINGDMPDSEKPFTMAHELAHAKGVMLEDEANMVAAAITLTSLDPYIRYSGYLSQIYNLFYALDLFGLYELSDYYCNGLNEEINIEYWGRFKYWSGHNLLSSFSDWFIDFYLRLMGEDRGIDAYDPGSGTPIPTEPTEPDEPTEPTQPGEPSEPTNPDYSPEFIPVQRLFFSIYEQNI